MKYIGLILFIALSVNLSAAQRYTCEIDAVKYLDTNKIVSIQKQFRTKVFLDLKEKKTVDINIGNQTYYSLKYMETQKLLNMIETDIYEKNGVQLEIIDISNSWSTGARLFHKNRMLMIGFCK